MEEYKFKHHFELKDKDNEFPEALDIVKLANEIMDLVNNGHYSSDAVLNVMANLYANAISDKLIDRQISMGDVLYVLIDTINYSVTERLKTRDEDNINDAIDKLKSSARLR